MSKFMGQDKLPSLRGYSTFGEFDSVDGPIKGGYEKKLPRCYKTHPALPLDGSYVIYGGSCSDPVVTDADIYVGLDWNMRITPRLYPWNTGDEVYFDIKDGAVPVNSVEFVKMIDWLSAKIGVGAKIHVGCVGGHGRTGMVLAALVSVRAKMVSEFGTTVQAAGGPISYVRQFYCRKAVESHDQIKFLVKHFECESVAPSRNPVSPWVENKSVAGTTTYYNSGKTSSRVLPFMDSGPVIRDKSTVWSSKITPRSS